MCVCVCVCFIWPVTFNPVGCFISYTCAVIHFLSFLFFLLFLPYSLSLILSLLLVILEDSGYTGHPLVSDTPCYISLYLVFLLSFLSLATLVFVCSFRSVLLDASVRLVFLYKRLPEWEREIGRNREKQGSDVAEGKN